MIIEKDEVRLEIKELIDLIRLDERYSSLIFDGIFPIDSEAIELNCQRRFRIMEISCKYGLN
ncbi:hypothetical protein LCH33_005888 (plasmid) [Pseudomonas amygdali]|uniref:Uncharacterized protein n=1 Tax=Pseudomonas syringae pv. helianthi TaxID=251654 RepID=A0A0P9TM81_9PSED|nr:MULTISPECIES: hypothetical protein [Pseudomonas syringae group]KPX42049.1 Uncharacterized protein ALO68_04907 [Pseudomonas syringae pv. helianthi]RMR06035.1 hypothetical protein ALP93_200195 [Pseudomonas syringae pv. helianthi]UBT82402.1 hypothetical protein LCH33_005888 [Pseudomonas amygdali]UNB66037.1 hypothetical protein MME54_27560 [Pseudomonas syringae pv. helianthi]